MKSGNTRYTETLEYLYSQLPAFERDGTNGYKPGLERALALESLFDNPHSSFPTIHVAGTNGKGSTAHTLAAILQASGYRTGLFTSPHLIDFRERIKVDGEMISEKEVIDFVEKFRQSGSDIEPSFFELTTTMAFDYFRRRKVDIAVIEVGLGGRLDSTNTITPILSVITNISLDHTSLLGNTRSLIASEKAGIIKSGIPVLIGETDDETAPVFKAKAAAVEAPIYFVNKSEVIEQCYSDKGKLRYLTHEYGEIEGELGGEYQSDNTATILSAVSLLRNSGMKITTDAVKTGFSSVCALTGLMGRWMKVASDPLVICDTGHNLGGWKHLVPQINSLPGKKHIVIGFVNDKDADGILELISSGINNAEFYFTQPDNHRALEAGDLYAKAEACGLKGEVFRSVATAYEKALAEAGKGDSVYVGGSSYVVADFLTYISPK